MRYLYGDSTSCPFDFDYLTFLQAALEQFADVLLADQEIGLGKQRADRRREAAERDSASIREVGARIHEVLGADGYGPEQTAATDCANAIDRAAADIVQAKIAEAEARLRADLASIDEEGQRARDRAIRAVERLLLEHDLPEAGTEVALALREDGYEGHLEAATPYGVGYVLDVEIPADSLFAQPLRVSRIASDLTVRVPKSAWLGTVVRKTRRSLGKLMVTAASIGPEGVNVALRATATEPGEGYDLMASREPPRPVQAIVVGKQERSSLELEADDAEALASFVQEVGRATEQLGAHRAALLSVTVDGERLSSRDARLAVLVERLIEAVAPVVEEIARRSMAPHELVLRRALDEHRREERFVSKAELASKIGSLPEALRRVFAPLALDAPRASRAASPQVAPAEGRAKGRPVASSSEEPASSVAEQSDPSIVIVSEEPAHTSESSEDPPS